MGAYEEVKCPECNGDMISRTGKFGVFWGCKNYPRCKGTRDSEGRSKADREEWKKNNQSKTTDSVDLVNDDSPDEDEMTSKDKFKFNRRKYD